MPSPPAPRGTTRTPATTKLTLDAAALDGVVADVRLYAAAEMVGLGQRLLDDTLQYVKEREQFGRPIAQFQAIQFALAEMATRIAASEILTLAATGPAPAVPIAKFPN